MEVEELEEELEEEKDDKEEEEWDRNAGCWRNSSHSAYTLGLIIAREGEKTEVEEWEEEEESEGKLRGLGHGEGTERRAEEGVGRKGRRRGVGETGPAADATALTGRGGM